MMEHRYIRRAIVDIPVSVASVLELFEASLADLSENGAQVQGVSLPEGTRLQIEYRGQTIFAICRWAEIDRMGVKFLFPLVEGPLYERLLMARAAPTDGGSGIAFAPQPANGLRPAARLFGRRG